MLLRGVSRCCEAPAAVAFQVSGVPLMALSGAAAFRWKRSCFRFDVQLRALPHTSVPRIIRISQAFSLPLQGFRSCWLHAHMRYSLQRLASQGTSSNFPKATWRKLLPGRDEAESCAGKHRYHSIIAPRSGSLMLHHHASMARSTVCKRLSCTSSRELSVVTRTFPRELSARGTASITCFSCPAECDKEAPGLSEMGFLML